MARRRSIAAKHAADSESRGRVVVTGAAGFAARLLVSRLCDAGYTVVAGDIAPPGAAASARAEVEPLDARALWRRLDVTSAADCAAACAGAVAVFHFAALVPYNHARAYSAEELARVNVGGTRTLLAAAAASGSVRAFVLASSTGVVFRGADIAGGDEALPARPPLNDAYSDSKAAAEALVLAAHDARPRGVATIALRPNGLWGGGGEAHHTPKLLAAAQAGIAGLMAVGPHALTDFTHRANFAAACECALRVLLEGAPGARARAGGRAFFVTDGWAAHTVEFFSPLLAALGFDAPFPSAVVPAGTGGHTACARVSAAELRRVARLAEEDAKRASVGVGVGVGVDAGAGAGGRRRRAASPARAAARRAPPASSFFTPAGRGCIVLTGPPHVPLPGAVLFAAAAVLESLCSLLRATTGVNVEPFLTVADARKVVRHNYYSSAAAASELGYAPVVSPAEGLAEAAAYYRGAGWRGELPPAGWAAWAAAPGGIGLVGLLAADVGGAGRALVAAAARAGAPVAEAAAGARDVAAAAAAAAAAAVGGNARPPAAAAAAAGGDDAAAILLALRWLFAAAVATHALEAAYAWRRAWAWRLRASGWAWETLFLGGLRIGAGLHESGGREPPSAIALLAACLGTFALCLAATPFAFALAGSR